MSAEPNICAPCMGSGIHHNTGFPEVCPHCLRDGIVRNASGETLVAEAKLCETCGARAYGSRCTAPTRWHEAQAFYTETVRAGSMLYHPLYQGAHKPGQGAHERYGIKWFNSLCLALPQYTRYASFGVFPRAELEDFLSQFAEKKSLANKYIPRLLIIGDLVRAGLPWWLAQVEEYMQRNPYPYVRAFVRVNGYARSTVRRKANPFRFPITAFDHDAPHRWLYTAWDRGYATLYSKEEFQILRGPTPVLTDLNPEPDNALD